MDELASLARDLLAPRDGCGVVRTSLLDCVQEAVTQFRRHVQSLKQVIKLLSYFYQYSSS